MASADRKLGNALGEKSARACDNCVRRRARWYCAADDAFLCQFCDSSVHSANPLARRHERVRLKIASIKSFDDGSRSKLRIPVPSWHQGFTRKARSPRQKKQAKFNSDEAGGGIINPLRLVPEISGEEHSHEENEEQLLYRVPIFDPFVAELCTSVGGSNLRNDPEAREGFGLGSKPVFDHPTGHVNGFLPSEMDLAEFAADVESLLGKGLDDEPFHMEGLGILDCDDEREGECSLRCRVKFEDEEFGEVVNNRQADVEFIGMGRETFELNFDYGSPITGEEEEDEDNKGKNVKQIVASNLEDSNKVVDAKKIFLRLDYENVMSAWDDQKSPWTTGERPDLISDNCWPHCMGTCGRTHVYEEMGMKGGHAAAADGGREARVSRYREKRRTRLFSKKIRYEVRKLNAEKRPRMKGRFVKRANFVAPPALTLLNNK